MPPPDSSEHKKLCKHMLNSPLRHAIFFFCKIFCHFCRLVLLSPQLIAVCLIAFLGFFSRISFWFSLFSIIFSFLMVRHNQNSSRHTAYAWKDVFRFVCCLCCCCLGGPMHARIGGCSQEWYCQGSPEQECTSGFSCISVPSYCSLLFSALFSVLGLGVLTTKYRCMRSDCLR